MATVQQQLSSVTLMTTYGCPDCADGGATYVVIEEDTQQSEHTWEFFNPHRDVSTIDALLQDLITALNTCTATADVTIDMGCTPT